MPVAATEWVHYAGMPCRVEPPTGALAPSVPSTTTGWPSSGGAFIHPSIDEATYRQREDDHEWSVR
jgi:hypothetical protein